MLDKIVQKIRKLCTAYMQGWCPSCFSKEDWVFNEEENHFECRQCGYKFNPNFHSSYIIEIENLVKG